MIFCNNQVVKELTQLLSRFEMDVEIISPNQEIVGSFWGDSEAGLVGRILYVRNDTPLHSALHEACHYICMDQSRRDNLHTDAAGNYDEENGVCYLQVLLAGYLDCSSQEQLMMDMDEWGYTFRLGSTRQWFESDAEDARLWLVSFNIINEKNEPLWEVRKGLLRKLP